MITITISGESVTASILATALAHLTKRDQLITASGIVIEMTDGEAMTATQRLVLPDLMPTKPVHA